MASSKRPKQIGLFAPGKYDAQIDAAHIILASPDRYGGETSLMVRCSRMLLARMAR